MEGIEFLSYTNVDLIDFIVILIPSGQTRTWYSGPNCLWGSSNPSSLILFIVLSGSHVSMLAARATAFRALVSRILQPLAALCEGEGGGEVELCLSSWDQ